MPDYSENFTFKEVSALLRLERHEFLNHLQIIYSYLELGKNQTAIEYMENLRITAPPDAKKLRAILAEQQKQHKSP